MIYLASDHAGFELKQKILEHLRKADRQAEDCGPFEFKADDDYPDFVYPCAVKVAAADGSRGIIIGGSGQGEAMVANKVRGVRAVVYQGGDLEIIRLARRHNDANVLSLGARFLNAGQAIAAIDEWLKTDFEGGRHQRRLDKIKQIEEENFK